MAFSTNQNKQSSKNPTLKLNEGRDAVFGIYLAEIVSTKDVSRTGRVRVFIPAISKDKNSTAGYFDAVWTSPFAGSTDQRKVGTKIESPQEAMSSYGLWAPVPDNGNLVLIAFGDGNTKYPMVLSCLFPDKFNYMLPSNAGGKTYQAPGLNLPTVEKNKRTADVNHNDTFRPIQHTLAEAIVRQGLAADPIRGAGSASARRESPSEVFGLLTPGPRDPSDFNYRLGGHSITLDDNLGSRQIRIRSAQGSQLLLDDTSGMVYLINRDGNAWMEFSASGDVYMYAEGDIDMRTKKSFNLRADQNVNIEAGNNINLKAAMDNDGESYKGEGQGVGGEITLDAKADLHVLAEYNLYATTMTGETHINSAGSIHNTTGDSLHNKVANDVFTEAGKTFTVKSGKDTVLEAGAQIVEKATKVLMNSGGASAGTAAEAVTAKAIATSSIDDAAVDAPGYDRDSDQPVITSGQRTGEVATITTIVGTMVTAEPFVGHGIPNPANDDEEDMVPDENIAAGFSPGSNGVGNDPADINSPAGLQKGSIGKDGTPTFSSPAQFQNNFSLAKNKQMEGKVTELASSMGASIPALRQPTMTPRGASKIGLNGKLTAMQNQSKQLGYNMAGLPADLASADMTKMKNTIGNAMQASGGDPKRMKDALHIAGVQTINDAQSVIYVSAGGQKIVDFKHGFGPLAVQMNTGSNLLNTSRVVRQFVNVPVSDNQMLSMISFADHIGHDNFSKSRVLDEINSGNWAKVPNMMTAHSSKMIAGKAVRQDDMLQRRQFEGELFQTPDQFKLPGYTGRVSWRQQANDLKRLRDGLT